MSECALCAKPPDVTWLGGYAVGEYIICAECYDRYIAGNETPEPSAKAESIPSSVRKAGAEARKAEAEARRAELEVERQEATDAE